jgi:hypothetical protein
VSSSCTSGRSGGDKVQINVEAVRKLVLGTVLGGFVHNRRDERGGADLPQALQCRILSHKVVATTRVDGWLRKDD